MLLANRAHTVGNRKKYVIDYSQWLNEGVTVSAAVVTSDSTTATVDGVTPLADRIEFFLNGGVLNENVTLSVRMTNTKTEIKNDTINVFVVAP